MKTLIAVPCMDMLHTRFAQSLINMRRVGDVQYGFITSSLVFDARNDFAERAIKEGFDRVLWLDSDMEFEPDLMERLAADMDTGLDMVTGLYFKREGPVRPVIFKDCFIAQQNPGELIPVANAYDDYPVDSLFPIAACGFGCVMTSVELLRKVWERLGRPFAPVGGFGEDLTFCLRVESVGGEIWCDSRVKAGHVAQRVVTEDVFLKLREAVKAGEKACC